MYEKLVTYGHQGKVPDDGSYPELIPAEHETDHNQYKPVERCPAAEAAAERKKDIFDEPEQNSVVTWRAGVDVSGFLQGRDDLFKGGSQIRFFSMEFCNLAAQFLDLRVLLSDLIH